ncbi:UEV domain-containing protein [Dunaliella salina]|uniref:UEV domain-containing protein n=1 Tax=Dunaliella salina TaxID=3046 RepID=A0ABQ7GUM3_DUNSA|nr:UEV domain-containing protein [Dunaliella salina]|eukprot:KAF5838314.1 UEV domain-containing protein [Dunaliella salina]
MPPSLRSYLQQVLANTSGPNSVPYSEITKAAIEEQLINLQEIFPSLGISVDEFCTNDGRILHLLKADGTIPVHYQGNKYNIPITIWLTEEFPIEAPIVFVVPTHSMIIKPGHSQVRGLKQEREGTEGLVKEMGSKSAQLQQWLDRNKPKADALEASGSIDWDAVIVPTDDASKQALQAQAEDLALEDSIVALDKAFHVGIQGLSLESYLKQVRTLCRRQFFARALGMKAAEMQQRQQPPLRPPPMPPVGVGLSSPLQGMDHFMPPPPIPVASRVSRCLLNIICVCAFVCFIQWGVGHPGPPHEVRPLHATSSHTCGQPAAAPHAAHDDPHPGLGSRQREQTLFTAGPCAASAAPLHAAHHKQPHATSHQQPPSAGRQSRHHAPHASQAHSALPQSAAMMAGHWRQPSRAKPFQPNPLVQP